MTFDCEHCDFTCHTIDGLNLKNWARHNLQHPIRHKVDGTCGSHSCLRYYWTRPRLINHVFHSSSWYKNDCEGLDDDDYLVSDTLEYDVDNMTRQTAVQGFRRHRAVKKPIRVEGLLTVQAHKIGFVHALLYRYRKTNREFS